MQYKKMRKDLCTVARMYGDSGMLEWKIYETLDRHMPNIDKGCWDRGCACFDDRELSDDYRLKVKKYREDMLTYKRLNVFQKAWFRFMRLFRKSGF